MALNSLQLIPINFIELQNIQWEVSNLELILKICKLNSKKYIYEKRFLKIYSKFSNPPKTQIFN